MPPGECPGHLQMARLPRVLRLSLVILVMVWRDFRHSQALGLIRGHGRPLPRLIYLIAATALIFRVKSCIMSVVLLLSNISGLKMLLLLLWGTGGRITCTTWITALHKRAFHFCQWVQHVEGYVQITYIYSTCMCVKTQNGFRFRSYFFLHLDVIAALALS